MRAEVVRAIMRAGLVSFCDSAPSKQMVQAYFFGLARCRGGERRDGKEQTGYGGGKLGEITGEGRGEEAEPTAGGS